MKQVQKPKTSGKKKDIYLTFTKRLIILVLWLSVIWVTWSYVLATIALVKYGDANAVTDVSTEVVRVLIAAILGYLCKAYFETKQEELIRLKEKKLDSEIEQANPVQPEPDPSLRDFSDLDNLLG